MLGKPGYNAWCREGFCSQDCYVAAGKPEGLQAPPIDPHPERTGAKPRPSPADHERWLKKDPLSYSLATYCLLGVPLWLVISALGIANGVFKEPVLAFWFCVVLGGLLLGGGLICGVAALIGMRQHGPQRILWKSLIGITLILIWGYFGYLNIREQSRLSQGQPAVKSAH